MLSSVSNLCSIYPDYARKFVFYETKKKMNCLILVSPFKTSKDFGFILVYRVLREAQWREPNSAELKSFQLIFFTHFLFG